MVDPLGREEMLRQLLAALREDDRLVGAVLVGSGAYGFRDEESDVDVVAVVGRGHNAMAVYQEWGNRLDARLPVVYRARQGPFQLANRLYGVLLDAEGQLLELDLSFSPIDELRALREHWKVLFDRTSGTGGVGEIHERMAAEPSESPPLGESLRLFDQVCACVLQARKALRRGQIWYATLVLHELQDLTLRLACLTRFDDARRRVSTQRIADELSADLLAAVGETVVPVDHEALTAALRKLAPIAFREARALHREAGEPFPERIVSMLVRELD